jgi:hypothetical protein
VWEISQYVGNEQVDLRSDGLEVGNEVIEIEDARIGVHCVPPV